MSAIRTALTWLLVGFGVSVPALLGIYWALAQKEPPADATEMRRAYEYYQRAGRGEVMSPKEAARRGYTVCVHVRPSLGPDGNRVGAYGIWTCTLPPVGPRARGEVGMLYVEEPDPCAYTGGECP